MKEKTRYHPAFHFYGFPKEVNPLYEANKYDKTFDPLELPYIKYCLSDKSMYPKASTKYIDPDDDFLLYTNDDILMNINFVFVNVHLFSEVANHFEVYDRYCDYDKHSREYKEFWGRETYRRKNGLTRNCKLLFDDIEEYVNPKTTKERKEELLKPLHITGDHYTYLNYSRIMRPINPEELEKMTQEELIGGKVKEGFPIFIDGDYWDYKLDLFCVLNNYDICKAKARRKGYSYKEGSKGSNRANLFKKTKLLYLAHKIGFLTDEGAITSMIKTNLDWFETHTHWKRNILSKDLEELKLGYKSGDGKIEKGWGSVIFSKQCERNPNQAVGKQAIRIVYEECGAFPNMDVVQSVTKSVNEVGRLKIGMSVYFGTGGTKEANYLVFKKFFRKPKAFGCVSLANIYDYDSIHLSCGFFFPQVLGLFPYIIDGNSQLITGFYDDALDKQYAKQEKTYDEYVAYIGQRANTPTEAFISNIENIFSSPDLNDHLVNLESNTDYRFWKDGIYKLQDNNVIFISNENIKKPHSFIEDVPFDPSKDVHGCIREYFAPIRVGGSIPSGLYIVTYDPVKVQKDIKTLTRKHSLASIIVWNMETWTPVAEYVGRMENPDDIDYLAYLFCRRWNAKVLPEVNVGEIVKNFKSWNAFGLLEKDPSHILQHGTVDPKAGVGVVIPTGTASFKYYGYFQELVYRKIAMLETGGLKLGLHNIYSIPLCKSMQIFDLDTNLDVLASARLAGMLFKSKGEVKKTKDNMKKEPMSERLKKLQHG